MQGPSGSPGNVTINAEGLGFSHNNTPACATAIGEKWKRHALDVCSLFFSVRFPQVWCRWLPDLEPLHGVGIGIGVPGVAAWAGGTDMTFGYQKRV